MTMLRPKMMIAAGLAALCLQGCVAGMAVGVAGEVLEGTANVGIGTVKTTGKVVGAVIPGGKVDDKTQADKKDD